jgi:hypothetical protein
VKGYDCSEEGEVVHIARGQILLLRHDCIHAGVALPASEEPNVALFFWTKVSGRRRWCGLEVGGGVVWIV